MGKKVPSFGPAKARVMAIGEAPGGDEEREGKPFIGYSGNLLREVLTSSGIPSDEVYYANICLERPPGNDLGKFFDASGVPNATVLEGLQTLKSDIERINPDLIIPLGNYPLKFLTGKGHWDKKHHGYAGISTYRGSVLPGTPFAGGRKCLPTYHPAAVTRNYSLKHIVRSDLGRAAQQSLFPEIRRPRKFILVDPRGPERDAWVSWLVSPEGTESPRFRFEGESEVSQVRSGAFLTSDIEYVGARLLCCGFTRHSDVAIVLATRDKADIGLVRSIYLSGVPLCFQNAMFDCSILEYHYKIDCLQYLHHDTMIMMHAAYTELPKDLGFIASIFTEQPVWFDHIDSKFWKRIQKLIKMGAFGGSVREEIEREYLPYNGIDTWVTHSAAEQMLADELTDSAFQKTYTHEMGLIRPLWDISLRGCPIDQTAMFNLKIDLQREVHLIEAGLEVYAGAKLNPRSNPQVATFLYDTMGIGSVAKGGKTKTGKWKMDDTTLADLQLKVKDARQRTAIKMVREARERLSLISKFCDIELDSDGRMRCHYDPAKTDTGRLSSRAFYPTKRGTNLQNVPRDTRVRAVFVPDRGRTFAYADLKSAESLVVAHITGDHEMLRLHSPEYMSGGLDGHKYVASFLLEKPIDRITKDERYLGKRVRHAGNYSLGWYKLMQLINTDAETTGVSIIAAQAKQLINKYRMLHPFLQVWWNDVLAELWKTHTIYTRHNRKRVFYGRPDEILPEAIAYDPQGTVGQTLNMGLLRLDRSYHTGPEELSWMRQWDYEKFGKDRTLEMMGKSAEVTDAGFEMLLQIHDAIGFQFPDGHGNKILPIVQELMQIPIPIKRRGLEPYEITIPVDIQVGWNWGEYDAKTGKNPSGLRPWKEGV